MKKHKLKTLDDLTVAAYNPRTITTVAADGLEESLKEFGDISGITWNEKTGNLVAGHQRVTMLKKLGAKLVGTEFVLGKKRYPVRIVNWSITKEKTANITANNPHISGTFIDDELQVLLEGIQDDIKDFDTLGLCNLLSEVPVDFEEEWEGMPECDHEDLKAFHSVKVNFTCVKDLNNFAKKVDVELTEKTRSFWYPEPIVRDRDMEYDEEKA